MIGFLRANWFPLAGIAWICYTAGLIHGQVETCRADVDAIKAYHVEALVEDVHWIRQELEQQKRP